MTSSVWRTHDGPAKTDLIAWVRERPWVYAYLVLTLWALVPAIRRIIDWKTTFSSVSLVSIVPLLSLAPAAYALVVTRRFARLERTAVIAAWGWAGAFCYAYAVGIVTGNVAAASYSFLQFMLPMCFGLFLATLDLPTHRLFDRVANFAMALSVVVSIYGFIQYVSPWPWDVYWTHETGLVSIGLPLPFQLRTFSTLNAPASLADFLTGVLVLNLPRLRGAKPLLLTAFAIDIVAFILTLVRGQWIGFIIAVLTFVALRPNKVRNLAILGTGALAVAVFVGNAGALFGTVFVSDQLSARFGTLTDIGDDVSFRDRQQYFGRDLAAAFSEPTGQGLGVTGVAAKLGSAGDTVNFDNGYIARFTEMGYFGTAAYLGTIAFTLVLSLRRWRALDRLGETRSASIVASAIAIQAALVFLDISFDHHAQLAGLFYWLSFALVFNPSMRREAMSGRAR